MAMRSPGQALGWLLGSGLSAMGGIAVVAALLPFRPGDARWEIAVLGPLAQASLLLTAGLCLVGGHAVLASALRVLVAVLVVMALLISTLIVGVVTVLLDLWLLSPASGFGGPVLPGLRALAFEGVAQGMVAAVAVGVVSAHFASALHALRSRH